MSKAMKNIDKLQHHSSSFVRSNWSQLSKSVAQQGSIAITHHTNVEMVLVRAADYEAMVNALEEVKAQKLSPIDELARKFKQELAQQLSANTQEKMQQLFSSAAVEDFTVPLASS